MTKLIPILSGRCLVVELPEVSPTPYVINTGRPHLSYLDIDVDLPEVDLPPGNWRIIGMLGEVTEGQIADIVDSVSVICTDGTEYGGWRNYVYRDDFDESILLKTALESLDSAILAEGFSFENTEYVKPDHSLNADYDRWLEAESRVLCRERCLLLGREA